MPRYIAMKWRTGYDAAPASKIAFSAKNDIDAKAKGRRILRTRGKWPYTSDEPDAVACYNLDPPSFQDRTRIGCIYRDG